MRKIVLSLAASLALASPALANEGRIEGRGGVIWDGSDSEAIGGVALGYDWDLGQSTFVGLETSADKVLTGNTRVSFGVGGRAGVKLADAGKFYGAASFHTKPCGGCEESVSAGAGYQHNLGTNLFAKVEYRHFFVGNGVTDSDSAVAGLGMRF